MTKEIIELIDIKIEKHSHREEDLLSRIAYHTDDDLSLDSLERWYLRHYERRVELERLRDDIIEMEQILTNNKVV